MAPKTVIGSTLLCVSLLRRFSIDEAVLTLYLGAGSIEFVDFEKPA